MKYIIALVLVILNVVTGNKRDISRRPVVNAVGDQKALEGESFILNCSHSSIHEHVQYKWILSSFPKYPMHKNGSVIVFERVDREDHISVSCGLVIGGRGRVLESLTPYKIVPYYMDAPVLSVISTSNWNVRKNDEVTIFCSVKCEPSKTVTILLKNGQPFSFKSIYHFLRVKKTSTGSYSCKVTNGIFVKVSKIQHLTVGGLSSYSISTLKYIGSVFFPMLIFLVLCLITCRKHSLKSRIRQLSMNNVPLNDSEATNEHVKPDTRVLTINDCMEPPSYSEAIGSSNDAFQPPSYEDAIHNTQRIQHSST